MTEMINNVAKAMWTKANEDPIRRRVGISFENDPLREWWIGQASVAIETMRKPTAEMQRVVSANWGRRTWSEYDEVIAAAIGKIPG